MTSDAIENWNPVLVVLGVLALIPIIWYVFWEIIQPALVSISPLFAEQSGGGRIGRYPDSFAQLALFATALLALFIYYNFLILVFDGVGEFIEACLAIYGFVVIVPIMIIKNYILPIFGIDRWEYNLQEEEETPDDSWDND